MISYYAGVSLGWISNARYEQYNTDGTYALFQIASHDRDRLNPLKIVQLPCVSDGGDDQNDHHPEDANYTTDIEQSVRLSQDLNSGEAEQRKVTNHQQNPQLRRAEFPERQFEFPYRVSRQVDVDRQHKIRDQNSSSYTVAHIAGQCHAPDEKQCTERIHDVIHVEPIARSLLVAETGQRAIQTIAEPVDQDPEVDDV